jgi:uncharacterized protein
MGTILTDDELPRSDGEVADFVRGLGVPGLFDVHVHLLPDRLQQAVWRYFDRLDDPPWPIRYRAGEDERLRVLRGLGVVAHTALAYAHKPGMVPWLNDHTLAAAERHPQVIPTFTFHPEPGVDEAVADAIARGGRVAKVHLQVGRFRPDDPALDEVWPQLVAAGVPALIHASAVYGVDGGDEFCGPDVLRALLERHPDLTVIVAHLGAPDTDGFLDLAEDHPRLYLDTAMHAIDPPYLAPVTARQRERVVALTERVLFGSDFPSIPHDYVAQVRGVARLRLDAASLRGVFYTNAARLLRVVPSGRDAP